ncbi:MAG: hypothetical protein KGL46_13785 [Hyphomicrobiales bacterium]|nr:hypothetical protein [Hyphomicrobiales bacterium]
MTNFYIHDEVLAQTAPENICDSSEKRKSEIDLLLTLTLGALDVAHAAGYRDIAAQLDLLSVEMMNLYDRKSAAATA